MTHFTYKVVPAPAKAPRARGAKSPQARVAVQFETILNEQAADGWEFQRAETLPSEERQGLTQSGTMFRTVLVFRKPAEAAVAALPRPDQSNDVPAPATTKPPSVEEPEAAKEVATTAQLSAKSDFDDEIDERAETNAELRDRVAELMKKVRS